MKFLIDNSVSPFVAEGLRASGHDAIHVRDLGLQHAPDLEIMKRAAADGRALVAADTDFSQILALQSARQPSLLLFRRGPYRPSVQLRLLVDNLAALGDAIEQGCVIALEETRIRVRRLPLTGA